MRIYFFVLISLMFANTTLQAQSWKKIGEKPSTLFMDMGEETYMTGAFSLSLVNASQTAARLFPLFDTSFDYIPGDRIHKRDKDNLYHLGDLTLSARMVGETEWKKYSTATQRKPVQCLPANCNVLAAADLSATLPSGIPVNIQRYWETTTDGELVLRFKITNISSQDVEIGSLGIPLIFNNVLEGKSLDQAHSTNVFSDPYIGKDAGYVLVNRLHGRGASLLVLPHENASFEAYNPLLDDLTPRHVVFEGFHEWMIHTKAHSETEWKGVEQWNEPTSTLLIPNESKNYSLKFVFSPSIREIENELIRREHPVALGLPGYVLPIGENNKLFLKYPEKVKEISIYPKEAMTVTRTGETPNRWSEYEVKGNIWGRARLSIRYEDNTLQTIHYKIIKSQAQVVADLGNFLITNQWYENPDDLFGRSPSIINYDYEEKRQITQERRAWFAGLSDEAGAGSWLAAVMKQFISPDKKELVKIKRFINETLWGRIQHNADSVKYGVKKSLFYYEPDSMPQGTYNDTIKYSGWAAWPKKEANNLGRSYNYPHVAAAHWVLYHLARNHGEQGIDWRNSLENAYHTSMAMVRLAPKYAVFGQMEGSVFLYILLDLKREGFTEMANNLEMAMKKRTDHWRSLNYPFGSEMPWDSTGQEEVYMWTSYFGYNDKADVTLNAILAYMPTVPHWGYNGSARRYWDFMFGGKLDRTERQLHHYGSALNAIPVLEAYRKNPNDFHLLRIGHAGTMGALANITEDGFGPAAFHSFPSTLDIDGYAGDYGCGFYGYAVNSGTYIINHPEFGWNAFSGNLQKENDWIKTEITSAGQNRVFIAPARVFLSTVAGKMKQVDYNPETEEISIHFEGDNLVLGVEVDKEKNIHIPSEVVKDERGYYIFEPKKKTRTLNLTIK